MRRRDLLPRLGAAAVVGLPLAARAQQPRIPVVGCLFIGTPELSAWWLEAWRRGLAEAGFAENRNLAVEYRWAEGDPNRLPALAADLVARRVDAIVTTTEPAAAAAKQATTTIPIVFNYVSDPVGKGLVASIKRPGGNITGMANAAAGEMHAKQFQLLAELVPSATRIGYMVAAQDAPFRRAIFDSIAAAGKTLGVEVMLLTAGGPEEIEPALADGKRRGIGAVLVDAPSSVLYAEQDRLVEDLARYALPAGGGHFWLAPQGGLFSYGFDQAETPYQTGRYIGLILRGASPAELPIMQPTKTRFAINLKTAKALGLSVPPALLAAADQVIE